MTAPDLFEEARGRPAGDSLWHNKDFRRLWGGETLSQLGSQVSTVAIPLTAISALHAGPTTVGLLATAQYLPVLLISPLAGAWLDTHRRRPVLIAAHLGRTVLTALIPLAYVLDALSTWLLLVVVLANGTLSAVFDIGYVTYLPSLVPARRLAGANARLEATYSIAGAGGPGIGGMLVQWLTAPLAVLADSVTYLLAAVLGMRIRHREPEPEPPLPGSRSPWRALREGLSVIWKSPVLRPTLVQSAAFNLLGQIAFTLFLLYGVRELHLSSGTLGVVLSIASLGGLAGAVLAGAAARRLGIGRAMVLSMTAGSLALGAIPAVRGEDTAVTVTVLVAGLLLHELGLAVFNVHSLSLRARLIPDALFGRATAGWRLVSNGTLPLNGVLAGLLGAIFGVRWAIAIALAVLALFCLAYLLSPVRSLRESDIPSGTTAAKG